MKNAFWTGRYDTPDYLFGKAPAAPLAKIAHRLPSHGRALTPADGEGRNSVFLAQRGLQVDAFDFAPNALEKASALAKEGGVSVCFQQSDITTWPWEATQYDLIAGVFFQFLTPKTRKDVFDGMMRALTPGGTLYVLGYRPEQIGRGTGGPPHAENTYTEDLLRNAFASLTIEHLRSWDEDLAEGRGHKGPSALIELLATKPS